jgi:hypothetical protein
MNDHAIEHRGAYAERLRRTKKDGSAPAERAAGKRHLQLLRKRAAAGDALAALALLAGGRPRRR